MAARTTIAIGILPNKRSSLLKNPLPSMRIFRSHEVHFYVSRAIFHENRGSVDSLFQFSPTSPVMEISAIEGNVEENKQRGFGSLPTKVLMLMGASIWLWLSLLLLCGVGAAAAASDSIGASGFGVEVAAALRGLGWPVQAVVFALATLPVIELRGAIPVGYWMKLNPLHLTVLAVVGNMVPVPFILLYLKKFATFLAGKNSSASHFLDLLFKRARDKAGPVEEFQWLGLMLFVAIPFPGTGAWTGAVIASILDMPFWSAFTANFFGVVFAGLLVNLLVNLGLKYAILTGVVLFFISTVMWSFLRNVRKSLNSN